MLLQARADSAGVTKVFTHYLTDKKLAYSVGFSGFLAHLKTAIDTLDEDTWVPAIEAGGDLRDGAWVAEITTLLDLGDSPTGMRVIARKERPHPGGQLTLTDTGGHRVTCFATNDPSPDLPALEVRHRRTPNAERRRIIDLDPNHGDRHPGPRDKQPRPKWLAPEKSKTSEISDPNEMVGVPESTWVRAYQRRTATVPTPLRLATTSTAAVRPAPTHFPAHERPTPGSTDMAIPERCLRRIQGEHAPGTLKRRLIHESARVREEIRPQRNGLRCVSA